MEYEPGARYRAYSDVEIGSGKRAEKRFVEEPDDGDGHSS